MLLIKVKEITLLGSSGDEEDTQCVDVASAKKCKKIQEKGKCNKGKWKTKCISTCGFCKLNEKLFQLTSLTRYLELSVCLNWYYLTVTSIYLFLGEDDGDDTTAAPATTPENTSDCSDLIPTKRCEELKQDGRCDKWQMMKDRCQATCGFCK